MNATRQVLQFRQVVKRFVQPEGSITLLNQVDAALDTGQSIALLGESGSGKSTFLLLAAGLMKPDAGEIELDGDLLGALSAAGLSRVRRRKIGFVFQQFHLIHTLRVLDNIRFQAALGGAEDREFETHLVSRLGLADQLRKYPGELSGGQQQKVAVARALLHRPQLVLADEPTGNLDESSSDQVLRLLLQLVQEAGSSLLLVTHSHRLADRLDAVWKLHGGRLSRAGSGDT